MELKESKVIPEGDPLIEITLRIKRSQLIAMRDDIRGRGAVDLERHSLAWVNSFCDLLHESLKRT